MVVYYAASCGRSACAMALAIRFTAAEGELYCKREGRGVRQAGEGVGGSTVAIATVAEALFISLSFFSLLFS